MLQPQPGILRPVGTCSRAARRRRLGPISKGGWGVTTTDLDVLMVELMCSHGELKIVLSTCHKHNSSRICSGIADILATTSCSSFGLCLRSKRYPCLRCRRLLRKRRSHALCEEELLLLSSLGCDDIAQPRHTPREAINRSQPL